ncbi:hypothetical protein INT47_010047 [Mucor saturninus]|uniref:CNH domain-containing protein n=1 Tax=Mucor saturninus TaxID=64648 RepID=A0A8H7UN67_9FUNG|nr:hypothetical protein INT47_010047 [Mucor saturninus]
MAEQYQPSALDVGSPTLEALYNDLDMYINELSVSSRTDTPTETTLSKRCNKDITPLKLDKTLDEQDYDFDYYTPKDDERDDEEDSPGYSPVLENYTRFSAAEENLILEQPTIAVVKRNSSSSTVGISPSAPCSPSFLRVGNSNGDYFRQQSSNKDEYVFTTRSSSLNRATAASSGKPILSPKMLFSNPTSPLALGMSTVHESSFGDLHGEIPNIALISYISTMFINEVATLNQHRKIFCTEEYPLSFNGEEALEIIRSFLPEGLGKAVYLDIAQCLMYCKPPLIVPIAYSEKSFRKNKVYDSATEMYTLVEETLDVEEIQGIYTPLTQCYSISCLPGQPGCYSAYCPNRVYPLNGHIIKKPAISIVSSTSHDSAMSRAWSATVAKDILKSMPSHEISRQEAIHELIYTEDDYVRDLKILDEDFAKELLRSQCIEESRKKEFHDKVVNNYQEILEIHDNLYKELRDHQANCQSSSRIGLVDKIGDIFLRHIHLFMDAYLKYGPQVVLAEYTAKLETENNMVFKHFIKTKEQLAQCRRLPFRHFIILPVTRLQRYSLLLDAVWKKTPEENPDKAYLAQCIDTIKSIAAKMDEGTLATKNQLRVLEIEARIRYKPDEHHALDLLNPTRKLIFEGPLSRKSHLVVETIELHVFLFDHLFLMTKVKKSLTKEGDVEYMISKRPIPMELLHMQEATEGFSIGLRNMSSTYSGHSSPTTILPSSPFGVSYPILIQHLGRHGADYLLYAENAASRIQWKEMVVKAKATNEMADIDKRIFEIRSLSDTTFGGTSSNIHNYGKVTCTVPFVGATGIRMIAIGTQQGIWMGIEGDTNTISLVLGISDVQQIAVLEDEHIFLILADKTLYAYALDALASKDAKDARKSTDRPHQKIAQHISFFHAGVCNKRTIVIAMKKRGVDSHFKVLEPICGDLRNPKSSKFFTKSGLFGKIPSWFKSYMEFYIGTESYAMHFLKARVVVVCARGFEIINLDALNMNRNLPDPTNPDFAFVQQRGDDLRPLGMFRCKEHYLLCYDAFAFMVNVHGNLVRESPLIEWEGVPQSVAFYYPYVVGFDPRFIEVRHVETGELIQVLAGTHMRCLQFIHQTFAPVIHGCMAHPFKPDFQYVFQLMGTFEPPL